MIHLNHLNIYLVGGAVRDELLSQPVKERDWVVVGSTPEELLSLGFKSVGKDFPVFLHPETKEEYALARTERKIGPGYTGFEFHTESSVTLVDDLARRDLTINAIAKDKEGHLIDPFDGQADLKNKILRHVSPAFVEDPVRILRIARFSARLTDFNIADETKKLMQHMVEVGEVDTLVSERVWREFFKALNETSPQRFFDVLTICRALDVIFPELTNNKEAIEALIKASRETHDPIVRFAALLHNLKNANAFCDRMRTPKEYKTVALHTAKLYNTFLLSETISSDMLLSVLESNDAFRRPERFKIILLAVKICFSFVDEGKADALVNHLEKALAVTSNIDIKEILSSNLAGEEIAKAIRAKRLECIKKSIED